MSFDVLRSYAHAVWHIFYPNLCLCCGEPLPGIDLWCCLKCQAELPYTDHHRFRENAFTERMWGRVPLESGMALFHFVKGGRVQRLIHQLKYEGKRDIGYRLGMLYGNKLLEQAPWSDFPQAIVPVPLHPRKAHRRGYNQAEIFGQGLRDALEIPLWPKVLKRVHAQESQTKKGRLERMGSVVEAFSLDQETRITGRHLLLIDDVLTTGATLDACAQQLLRARGVRISMATIALAQI